MSNKYNGWTNYETWRVSLEYFDGVDWYGYDSVNGDELQEMVEESVIEMCPDNWARSLAFAFLSDVNWNEIADHINEDLTEENEE